MDEYKPLSAVEAAAHVVVELWTAVYLIVPGDRLRRWTGRALDSAVSDRAVARCRVAGSLRHCPTCTCGAAVHGEAISDGR